MNARAIAIVVISLISAIGEAGASGTYPAATSQLTYSFTCASGPSGQISYSRQMPLAPNNQHLVALVNGLQIQDNGKLKNLLAGKSIESISAGCEGDTAVIFIDTWLDDSNAPEYKGILTIRVDKSGVITSIG